MDPIRFLGLNFDDLQVQDIIRTLTIRHPNRQFTYIVTPNADHLARLKRLPPLRQVYDNAFLRILDSQLLHHAATALRLSCPHVATGADITTALLGILPPQRVAIIGLDPKFIPALTSRYPRLSFIHHNPPQDLMNNRKAFQTARDFATQTAAPFTFIALGSPTQELLAYAISRQPNATGIGLCIGAALEFAAGVQSRAPIWMRTAGCEWVHRLIKNPRRLARRYLIDDPPIFLTLAAERLKQIFSARLNQTAPRSSPYQPLQSSLPSIAARDLYPPLPILRLHEIQDAT